MTLSLRSIVQTDRPGLFRLALLAWLLFAATPVQAEYVMVTGATWNDPSFEGMIRLPSGSVFDIGAEQLALITTDVADDETLIFDVAAATARLDGDAPSVLLSNDPFLMTFARESEVQTLSSAGGVFSTGPSDAAVDDTGAVTWAGMIFAPAPSAGGGGTGPTDTDGDGVPDSSDNCVSISNASQANNDGDAQGDACDPDDDNDGVLDGPDNCPMTSNASQTNTDGDSLGDACDPDDDNDGLSDILEIGTYGTNPLLEDTDGDTHSDLDEINAGTDPIDPNSFPGAFVPMLGPVGTLAVGLLLTASSIRRVRRRRAV